MLNWTKFDTDGSIYSRGKSEYYVILVRGLPKERPKDCVIELYTASREITISEIKYNAKKEAKLLSRIVVIGNLSDRNVLDGIEEMKETAIRKENENPYGSLNSAYRTS